MAVHGAYWNSLTCEQRGQSSQTNNTGNTREKKGVTRDQDTAHKLNMKAPERKPCSRNQSTPRVCLQPKEPADALQGELWLHRGDQRLETAPGERRCPRVSDVPMPARGGRVSSTTGSLAWPRPDTGSLLSSRRCLGINSKSCFHGPLSSWLLC